MAKVQAEEIYKQVLRKLWDLKNSGETTIIYGNGLGDCFHVHMYGKEYIQGVVVEWNGKTKKVPLPNEDAIDNNEIVARAIMSAFAQLYLGKNVDPYKKSVNENQPIRINESQLRNIIKESLKKVLNEAAFSPNYPENTINNTIWANYNLPWNKVDDTPEQYKGIWYITVDFFDYTEHMGTVEIDRQFKSLEQCLDFAQQFSIEDAERLCNEEITDEGFSSISLNINCQTEKNIYEVANTKMFMPKSKY